MVTELSASTKRIGEFRTPDGAVMHYLTLGTGAIPIAVIPGAGDGLNTLDKAATRLALYFARRRQRYRLLILSRRQPIPAQFGMERHADDMLAVMRHLNWGPCVLECNSAGGPIGQHIAVCAPEQVRGLILSCTLHRSNPGTNAVVERWLEMIARRRWAEFGWSSIELTFRPSTVRWYRLFRPLLPWLSPPPRDPTRITHTLKALLDFDNRPLLPAIACPTLVTGGAEDRIIPAEIQREMAELIPTSQLILASGYGHGNDQENPAYERDVRAFAERCFLDTGPT
jgi:pimeloyl-ACP methyl ester carboxylesterase